MKYRVKRAMKVWQIEEIVVDMPEGFDPDDYDFAKIDEFVLQHGEAGEPTYEGIDDGYDDLQHETWERVHVNYPHWPGYLHDCPACEEGPCVCADDPTLAPCVSDNCERKDEEEAE